MTLLIARPFACVATLGFALGAAASGQTVTSAPAWAPDGSHLLFVSEESGRPQIWRMATDGTAQRPVSSSTASDRNPAYSPDGRSIAFSSDASGTFQIWRMAADGTGRVPLTRHEDPAAQARWSADGEHIYYSVGAARDGAQKRLYRMSADGSGVELLTSDGRSEIYPVPSPVDGRLLSASKPSQGEPFQIHVREQVRGESTNISRRETPSYNPDWSPDGEWIAFVSHVGEDLHAALFVVRADGSEIRQLTDFPEGSYQPRWSPDGGWIAFRRGWHQHVGLFLISVEGSEAVQLTNAAGPAKASQQPQ